MNRQHRFTIACDFDGVLHRYDSPWVAYDVIPDPPVEGAIEWLDGMMDEFDVVIHTTRGKTAEGANAVLRWLLEHGLELGDRVLTVSAEKPPALVYIDDRAWRFDGTHFPTADEVHRARPWHKAVGEDAPTHSIVGCARCHSDGHADLVRPLEHPVAIEGGPPLTHWASCPTNGEPILFRVEVAS